jgi:phospholipid-binding lipoprotein MlaA
VKRRLTGRRAPCGRERPAALPAALPALALTFALLSGCATTGGDAGARNPADPWEGWNRKVFAFNDAVDRAVLEPVARTYRDVVPRLMRTGVDNVLGNIRDVWSTANHFLQGKPASGLEMGMRVLTNTFFGLGGLLDPATEMRLTRRSEDLGQTLGVWGVGPGPFVMLPLLGPSTVRDTAGFLGDRQVGPSSLPSRDVDRYTVTALEVVSTRAGLLGTTQMLGEVALDRYSLIRDGYLARRRDAIYDGSPPMEFFDDSGFEDEDEALPQPAAPAPPAPRAVPATPPAVPARR